jgi:hypothetical protein
MSSAAFDLLRRLLPQEVAEAGRTVTELPVASELRDALTAFIRFHIEGLRRLNVSGVSMKVLGEVPSASEG